MRVRRKGKRNNLFRARTMRGRRKTKIKRFEQNTEPGLLPLIRRDVNGTVLCRHHEAELL